MAKVESYIPPSKILPLWSTGEYVVHVEWMKSFKYFSTLFRKIESVSGDIVECGVGEGTSLQMLAYLAGSENYAHPREVFGFDSFEGWPEPTEFDVSPRDPQKGEWATTEEMVKERLEKAGLYTVFPNLKIELVKGFLSETLPVFVQKMRKELLEAPAQRKIALLHIDVDLYPGYRDALHYLFPQVVRGGIVLFDEYKEFPNHPSYGNGTVEKWPGCTKAVYEYFASLPLSERPQIHFWPETRKYYVIK